MDRLPFGLGVRGVIYDNEGRILLLKRSESSKHFKGEWEFPGGKADEGEAFDQALLREVQEEAQLDVSVERLLGATQYDMSHVKAVLLFMECTAKDNNIRLSEEHQDHTWVSPAELSTMKLTDQMVPFVETFGHLLGREAGQE